MSISNMIFLKKTADYVFRLQLVKAERIKTLATIAKLQEKVIKLDEDIARYDEETDAADSI